MALWRDELVDIVVTDIFMSENDGFEVIQEMKKVARTPKIIAMSGGGQRGLFDWNLAALSLWADRNTPFLVQVSTIRTVEQGLAVLTRRQHSEAMMQERRDHRYGGGLSPKASGPAHARRDGRKSAGCFT